MPWSCGLSLAHDVSRRVGEPEGAVAGRDPQRADVVLATERGDRRHRSRPASSAATLCWGPSATSDLTTDGRDVGGTSARRDSQTSFDFGSIRQTFPSPKLVTHTCPPPTATAARIAPDRNRLANRVRLRVDADERVGAGLGLRSPAAAGEEEAGEGGSDQGDADGGDGERPAAALRLGDPERRAGRLDRARRRSGSARRAPWRARSRITSSSPGGPGGSSSRWA